MKKIEITRQILNRGMQGKIHTQEIVRFNKEVDKFNLQNKIKLEKEEKLTNSKQAIFGIMNEMEDDDAEDMIILKTPKLRKIRSYRGFY